MELCVLLLVHLSLFEGFKYDFLRLILPCICIPLTHHKVLLWWSSTQGLIFVCFLSLQGRISILPTAQLLKPELNWQQNTAVSSYLEGSIHNPLPLNTFKSSTERNNICGGCPGKHFPII